MNSIVNQQTESKKIQLFIEAGIYALIVFFFMIMYLLLRTSCNTFDSIQYIQLARTKPWISQFHPHHLLYHQILFFIAQIEKIFGLRGIESIWIYVIPSALFGGLTCGVIWDICRIFTGRIASALASIGTGFTYSLVFMSTDVEKYPIAVFFMLKSIFVVLRFQNARTTTQVMKSALFLTAATVMHQTVILAAPVMLILFFLYPKPNNKPWKTILTFSISLIICVGLAYSIVAYIQGIKSLSNFGSWVTNYAQSGSWGHGFSDPVYHWIIGNLGALIGTDIFFSKIGWAQILSEKSGFIFVLVYISAWIWVFISLINKPNHSRKIFQIFLIIWIWSFSVFIIWWEPLNTKVAVLYTPAIWILFNISIFNFSKTRFVRQLGYVLFTVLVIQVGCINLSRAITLHHLDANQDLTTARKISDLTSQSDVILVPCDCTVDLYLMYFFNRPQTTTLRNQVFQLSNKTALKSTIDDSFQVLCKMDTALFFTRFTCYPPGKDLSGNIKNKDVSDILADLLDYADIISQLPNGDVLLKLRKDEYCKKHYLNPT